MNDITNFMAQAWRARAIVMASRPASFTDEDRTVLASDRVKSLIFGTPLVAEVRIASEAIVTMDRLALEILNADSKAKAKAVEVAELVKEA